MPPPVERRDLSPDLSISRVITGLWQLADMERDGRRLDLAVAEDGPVAMFAPDGGFLALYERRGDQAAPVAVFV